MPPPTTSHRTASGSIAPAYFAALFDGEVDPWGFDTSSYEAAKYAATLAALPHARYRRALEIGCANGALTERLALRCDALTALDVAPAALARARARVGELSHVAVRRAAVPEETPAGPFDLVVLSEVGYYLSRPDLEALRDRLGAATAPGGHLVLAHWTGETDYPLTADAVHDAFAFDDAWRVVSFGGEAAYRLDVLARAGAPSGGASGGGASSARAPGEAP